MADTKPANKVKKGDVVSHKGEYYSVLERNHHKMGRQGGIVKMKLKNLVSGNNINHTVGCDDGIEMAEYTRSKGQYLYSDDENHYFMDQTSYEQFSYPISKDETLANYLKEDVEVDLNMSGESLLSISVPIKMSFKVTDCPPNEKGDTATGATKQATLETGMKINVPLFIEIGEEIIVNTLDDEYVERKK